MFALFAVLLLAFPVDFARRSLSCVLSGMYQFFSQEMYRFAAQKIPKTIPRTDFDFFFTIQESMKKVRKKNVPKKSLTKLKKIEFKLSVFFLFARSMENVGLFLRNEFDSDLIDKGEKKSRS